MGAVVGRERQDAGLGKLAVPDLVRDLARLHVPDRVVGGRLEGREPPERAVGELGVAADRLHRDDERVPAEQGEEPRDARRRDVDAALEGRVLEVERLEVADGLRPGAPRRSRCVVRTATAGSAVHAGHRQRHLDRVAGQDLGPLDAEARDREPRRAGVPHALRGDLGDEQEPAVRVLRPRVRAVHGDDELAPEVAVDVDRAQLLAGGRPAGVDRPPADDAAALDVEDVREVRGQLDLDRQVDRAPRVVHDVEVLVDAAADRPVEADREAVARDRPVAVEQAARSSSRSAPRRTGRARS